MNGKFTCAAAVFLLGLPVLIHAEEGGGHFCTMDQAVDQMISAAGVDTNGMYKDLRGAQSMQQIKSIERDVASGLVRQKLLQDSDSKSVEITWKDIYDMRGTMSAYMCNEGSRMYCVSSFIDAIGSGLTGNRLGRSIYTGGLLLAGPPGFVMMSGMEITQKTFQCKPDTVAMALEAGESVVIMLPWCKAPGVKALCARAGQVAGRSVLRVVGTYMGKEYVIGTGKLLESEAGGEFIKLVADKVKEEVTKPVTHQIHSALVSTGDHGSAGAAPEAGAPAPVTGIPIGDGLYYDDPAADFGH